MPPAYVPRPLAHRMCPLLFCFSVQSQLLALSPPGQGLKEASPPILRTAPRVDPQPALMDIWEEAAQDRLLLAAQLAL